MELTWQDVRAIVAIANQMLTTFDYSKVMAQGEKGYYTEILNRFNKTKK